MDDPIITSREAASLLGVSTRTAQVWIEQYALESWKTPGGHRRVRRSEVIALRERLAPSEPKRRPVMLVQAGKLNNARVCEALSALGEVIAIDDSDPLSSLTIIGRTMPAVVVIEVGHTNLEQLAMLTHLFIDPLLGHTHVLVLGDMTAGQVVAQMRPGEQVSVASPQSGGEELRAIVETILAQGEPGASNRVPALSERMRGYPVPPDENERLKALNRTGLVDTPLEPAFDKIVQMAANVLQTPVCLMSLLTHDRQWFKAQVGLTERQTPRLWAFCNHTIVQNGVFVVEDAAADDRFRGNPLVTGTPEIRFYAGAPIKDYEGYALGSLCVIDNKPRQINDEQRATLKTLAELTSDRINLRTHTRQLAGGPTR
ncbi:GAF domain-containing protein [Caballeronia sordidicola]|uniref:GAF domain-containing protein n=1 Tax=Caballeronia sordidicola TaxID=196367 RepID=UPI00076B0769|nr:GAF domain-containing protein [Caballeronia sordidicola]AME25500.1 hypothetical protein AXG89_16015 [Burkholderia sp. PAMC 26561]